MVAKLLSRGALLSSDKKSKLSVFTITASDKNARVGKLITKSGVIETPFFMPVATKGTVKYLSPHLLERMKNTAVISNAFVLYLRPGIEFMKKVGGIKKFMKYHGINATDSGGFQMYKDTFLIKTTSEGVYFRSPFDGSKHFITPEKDMEIQQAIDSDIAMCLDTMPLISHSKDAIITAVEQTTAWANRCLTHHKKLYSPAYNSKGALKRQLLFAITQGGIYPDLRKKSCLALSKFDFDGFSIGGLALGEDSTDMFKMVKIHKRIMPKDKPCYLMGLGSPIDILQAISMGVDMFDSRFPTQNARRGTIFTSQGKLRILRKEYEHDLGPLDSHCDCFVCKTYTRAYVRYQLMQGEGTGYTLATYHQLYYLMRLVEQARDAIKKKKYSSFMKSVIATYAIEEKRIQKLVDEQKKMHAKNRAKKMRKFKRK